MLFPSATNLITDVSDKEGIEKVLNDFSEGWNAHDVKIFSKVFAEDADFTNVKGAACTGRVSIEEKHEHLFKTIWSDSTLTITKNTIRLIKSDVAAVDAWWQLEGLKSIEGSARPDRNGLLNFIMTKQGSQWLITVMHNMDLPGSGVVNC